MKLAYPILLRHALVFSAILFGAETIHAQSFVVGLNFAGTKLSDLPALNSAFQFIPPDTMGAIGPSSFAEFTNGSFAVYNKATGSLAGSRVSLTNFWINAGITGLNNNPTAGSGTTDPHVIYDSFSNRWFAAAIDTPLTTATNRILVGVSQTSDPAGAWTGFAISGSATSQIFADFPSIGINADAFYLTTNNFSNTTGSATGVDVLVLPKAGLTGAVPTIANRTFFDNQNFNNTGFSPHPITDMNNGTGSERLLSDFNTPAGTIKFSTIANTNTAAPTLNTAGGFLSVAALPSPPDAQQQGGPNTIDAGDNRFGANVLQQGGKIWSVQGVSVSGRDALRWFRNNASTLAIEESGIIGESGHDYYTGSIAVNAAGDVVVGYTRSGSTEFASSYASVGKYNGATTTFASPTLLKAGVGSYNVTFGGPTNRWGDYSQTTVDPSNPNIFWTIQEYAAATNAWGTEITQIIVVPEPGSAALFAAAAGLCLSRRRARQIR